MTTATRARSGDEAEARAIRRIEFGNRLKTLRLAAGWSQEMLAIKSGIRKERISRLEGGYSDPRASTLERLRAALGCGIDELI